MRSDIKCRFTHLRNICHWLIIGIVAYSSQAVAYSFDPGNADEQGDGPKYFGSAKTEAGALMPDTQFLFSNRSGASVLAITDEQGRYRIGLPAEFIDSKFRIVCYKEGYINAQMTTRPGPKGPRQTVQVDCVFQKK